jgi:hypothetical protein
VICINHKLSLKWVPELLSKNRQSSEIFLEILGSPNLAKWGSHTWKILQGKFEKKEHLN